MNDNTLYPIPCTVILSNGDSYDSMCFGFFQMSDNTGSFPVATVKLQDGRVANVKNLRSIKFQKASYITKKNGERIYNTDIPT